MQWLIIEIIFFFFSYELGGGMFVSVDKTRPEWEENVEWKEVLYVFVRITIFFVV